MSITTPTIQFPHAVIELEYRVANMELVLNRIMSALPTGTITEKDLTELGEKAKELIHEKYPSVTID